MTFFKIGLFTIGGGYAMPPLIQADVQAKGWMTAKEVVNFIAVSESTPGPFAVNVSTYVGAELAGLPGAFCATLGVVPPSLPHHPAGGPVLRRLPLQRHRQRRHGRTASGCDRHDRRRGGLGGADGVPAGGLAAVTAYPLVCSLAIFALMAVLTHKKLHPSSSSCCPPC